MDGPGLIFAGPAATTSPQVNRPSWSSFIVAEYSHDFLGFPVQSDEFVGSIYVPGTRNLIIQPRKRRPSRSLRWTDAEMNFAILSSRYSQVC